MSELTWEPWQGWPNQKYYITHLHLGKARGRHSLCMMVGPEGYQTSIAGRHTRPYANLDDALRAALRLLRTFLRDEIRAAEAALDEVKALPMPEPLAQEAAR